ncbi:uncharacterized protein LOC144539871 [Centroberyx gerrardi]
MQNDFDSHLQMSFSCTPEKVEDVELEWSLIKTSVEANARSCGEKVVSACIGGNPRTHWWTPLVRGAVKVKKNGWHREFGNSSFGLVDVVDPIFIKGDQNVCSNYRGMRLLSLPGKAYAKVLERSRWSSLRVTRNNADFILVTEQWTSFLQIIEGSWEFDNPVNMCFEDLHEMRNLPGKDCPLTDLSISIDNTTVLPSQTAKTLGVILDNQLSCSAYIKTTIRSCRFSLYNIRKIHLFLTRKAAQLLVQALVISRLDYCNVLLAGLPASAIRPLQRIQNTAARLVLNQPKFSHVTPLFQSLHWLPISARIKFKTLVLAYRAVHQTALPYLQSMVRSQTSPRSLRSSTLAGRLAPPSLRGLRSCSSRSRLFSSLAPQWWNELPPSVRTVESLPIFRRRLKTHLFRLHLDPS